MLRWLRSFRPSASRVLISLLIAGLGWLSGGALSRVDQDLRKMYTEYTLGAADLAHISADVMRYRNTIIRALQADSKKDFERITESPPISGQESNSPWTGMRPPAYVSPAAEEANRKTSKPSAKVWISTFLRPARRSICYPVNGTPHPLLSAIAYGAMPKSMLPTTPAPR